MKQMLVKSRGRRESRMVIGVNNGNNIGDFIATPTKEYNSRKTKWRTVGLQQKDRKKKLTQKKDLKKIT